MPPAEVLAAIQEEAATRTSTRPRSAVAVLLGVRVVVRPEQPTLTVTVPLDTLDLAALGLELDPHWLRSMTSERLTSIENLCELEAAYRAERWTAVEDGGWPTPEAPWVP